MIASNRVKTRWLMWTTSAWHVKEYIRCHYRQMSLPSDKNLQMVHKEELNIVFDHNWYNYSLLLFVVDEIESIGNSDQRLFLLNTEY